MFSTDKLLVNLTKLSDVSQFTRYNIQDTSY